MRIFQNIFVYPSYTATLDRRLKSIAGGSFKARRDLMVADRYCAVHYLQPEGQGDDVFLTTNADEVLQRAWATESGLPASTSLDEVMLAQVEAHRSEVFYTQDPARYGPAFLKRLPGCVKARVCWQSPPANAGDLASYDLVLNNFPTSLREYAKQGVRTAYFTPSHDPAMTPFGDNTDRPIDVVFVGGYSRYHRNRAAVLEQVAGLRDRFNIVLALDRSRLTRLAESPLGRVLPLSRHRRPADIRRTTVDPVFGAGMYRLFSQAKIVLNGAVDSAGPDRGNMRCFEALGCGALMVSDRGDYPEGMVDGQTMSLYGDASGAVSTVLRELADNGGRLQKAAASLQMMRTVYAKNRQWQHFVALVSSL